MDDYFETIDKISSVEERVRLKSLLLDFKEELIKSLEKQVSLRDISIN